MVAPTVTQPRAAIVTEIERIARLLGRPPTPEELIAAAAEETNPLHAAFEWDDAQAAVSWRLHQARELIRSVRLEVNTVTRELACPRYVPDPDLPRKQAGYVDIEVLQSDADRAERTVRQEVERAAGHIERAIAIGAGLGRADLAKALLTAVLSRY